MPMTLVNRTTRLLRAHEYDYDEVVRRVPNRNRARWGDIKTIAIDFGGFGDLAAWKAGVTGCLIVQVCGANEILQHTERYKSGEECGLRKQLVQQRIRDWIDRTGNRFQIWGWEKVGYRWQLIVIEAILAEEGKINFQGAEDPL